MFYDLRDAFAKATAKARSTSKGVWAADKTHQFFKVTDQQDISENLVLMPKIFRRLTTYLKENPTFDALDFLTWLETNPEKVFVLDTLNFTHLDNLFEVNDKGKIKLASLPEEIVFLS